MCSPVFLDRFVAFQSHVFVSKFLFVRSDAKLVENVICPTFYESQSFLVPEFRSCCWLYAYASRPLFALLTTYLVPLLQQKEYVLSEHFSNDNFRYSFSKF